MKGELSGMAIQDIHRKKRERSAAKRVKLEVRSEISMID